MKDSNKNLSNDPLDDDIFDDVSDIDGIEEEYYAEFGYDEFDEDYDDRLEKVLDELSELKSNMSSGAAKQSAYSPSPAGNEVALYNEISRLRDELAKTQNSQAIQAELNKLREEFNRNDRGDEALRDEVRALKAQIRALKKGNADDEDIDDISYGASGSDIRKLYTEISTALNNTEQKIIESVDAISKRIDGEIKFAENEDIADVFQALKDLRSEIAGKSRTTDEAAIAALSVSSPDEVNLFLSEIVSLRDELQEYKDNVSVLIDKVSGVTPQLGEKEDDESIAGSANVSIVLDELTSIRTEISNYTDELDVLKSGISDIKNIVKAGVISGADGSSNLETALLLSEINELKMKIDGANKQDASAESLEELRGDIRNLSEQMNKTQSHVASISIADSDLPSDVKETLSIIFDEIHALREEPDYSVMNEILALREEFQQFKEQLAKSAPDKPAPAAAEVISFDHAGAYAQTVEEIRSLRDQLFAISMAKVANGKKEPEYENYNNILLDEIASLREELQQSNSINGEKLAAIGVIKDSAGEIEKLIAAVAELKAEIASLKDTKVDIDYDKIAAGTAELKAEIASLKDVKPDIDYDKILGGMEELRAEISSLKEVKTDIDYDKILSGMDGLKSDVTEAVSEVKSEVSAIDISGVKAEIAALEAKLDCSDENDKLFDDLNNIKESVSALSAEVARLADMPPAAAPEPQPAQNYDEHFASQKEVNMTVISMLSDIIRAVENLRAQQPNKAAALYDNKEIMDELEKLRAMIGRLENEPVPQPSANDKAVEEAIAQLREELAAASGLKEEKPKKSAPAKKSEAAPVKTEEEAKPEVKEEKKAPVKKAASKKPAAKKATAKKPAAKKAAPAKKKEAKPKAEKPSEAVKLADKQVLDEYVATLDKGEADDISKMLKDILNYDDNNDDI